MAATAALRRNTSRLIRSFNIEISSKVSVTSRGARNFAKISEALVYKEHGDPEKVLRLESVKMSDAGPKSVVVQMLAAPVNPSDINQIQGTYPLKPKLPAIGGNEGVGKVVEIGKDVTEFKPGDTVIPAQNTLGTWCRYQVLSEEKLIKLPTDIPVEFAATVSVNPCTAYRMLKDFQDLNPGDTVIQNGANSGVGQAIIQIAAALGYNTINVVRDRPNLEDLKQHLMSLGAKHVITEEVLNSRDMKLLYQKIPVPRLGFDCVGGKSATNVLRQLQTKGTLVTYGGMSRQPVIVPTGALIFKDVRIRGFWRAGWSAETSNGPKMVEMLHDICSMNKQGKIKAPPCTKHLLKDYATAIALSMKPFSSRKQLLILNEE